MSGLSLRLDGRVALVTGGYGVLGGSPVDGLVGAGARVAILGRRRAAAEEKAEAVRQAGGEAIAFGADVLAEQQVSAARDQLIASWHRVDILINAVGGNVARAREFGWSETDYAAIVSWFSLAYGFGLLVVGRTLDWIGVRRGFSFAIVAWSIAAIGHALARTVTGFSVARAALGLGESANFPGAIKSVAEWFPKRERALATGIFNAGSNVGAIVAPLMVPAIALAFGWQLAFIATGALGFVWLVFWLAIYRSPAFPWDGEPGIKPERDHK